MPSPKGAVLARHPAAMLVRDVDGFCWVRDGDTLTALNDARQPTKSAAQAWKSVAEHIRSAGVTPCAGSCCDCGRGCVASAIRNKE